MAMSRPSLQGASILVVEDEPLIALDIADAFEGTGAQLTTTNSLKHAKVLVEHDGLSAAIIDHALSDGDSTSICEVPTAKWSELRYGLSGQLEGPRWQSGTSLKRSSRSCGRLR